MADYDSKSWYTKWRPKTLEEYSGPVIKNIVSKRFRNRDEFPHTIYIRGPRGTGKTTFARIISKYYLCENPHADGTPCEECQTCQEINDILISGESGTEAPGVTEVDATTANGKEAIQEIIEDAIIAPMYSKYKIIIFDECHMITPQAQNSLLKIIEDIPEHLVCIFCTTNDEKVLQTIKSRMQLVLEARKQTIPDMVARLKVISEAEQLKVSDAALEIIAKKGDRVPRECINILESVAKTYDKEVTLENVRDYLGDVGSDLYIKFFAATNNKLNSSEKEEGKTRIDYALNSAALVDIMNFIAELKLNGTKIPDFIKGLMSFVLDSLYIKHGVNVDEYPPDYVSKIKKVFKYYEAQDFDALIQIIYDVEWKVNTDNDKESEFLLLLTALRISKIKLISNGLSDTLDTAVAENKISMVEHRKALERNRVNLDISEQLKMEMTPATIKEEFDDAAIITEEMEITKPSTVLPSIDPSEYEQLTANKQTATKSNNSNTNEVDNFFDSL